MRFKSFPKKKTIESISYSIYSQYVYVSETNMLANNQLCGDESGSSDANLVNFCILQQHVR